MRCWGEILCENGSKPVIAVKYIIRIQPVYTRTLWKYPVNNEVIKKKKRILAECSSVTSHRTNAFFACCNQEQLHRPVKLLWEENEGPAPSLASHACWDQICQESEERGGLLLPIRSAQGTSGACRLYDPVTAKQHPLFLLLLAGKTSISASCWRQEAGYPSHAGRFLLQSCSLSSCCWQWDRILTLRGEVAAGENAFQTQPFQLGGSLGSRGAARIRHAPVVFSKCSS